MWFAKKKKAKIFEDDFTLPQRPWLSDRHLHVLNNITVHYHYATLQSHCNTITFTSYYFTLRLVQYDAVHCAELHYRTHTTKHKTHTCLTRFLPPSCWLPADQPNYQPTSCLHTHRHTCTYIHICTYIQAFKNLRCAAPGLGFGLEGRDPRHQRR